MSCLSDLDVVNESEVLNVLTKRFQEGHYQTRVGNSLLSINPMQKTDPPCSVTVSLLLSSIDRSNLILLKKPKTCSSSCVSLLTCFPFYSD